MESAIAAYLPSLRSRTIVKVTQNRGKQWHFQSYHKNAVADAMNAAAADKFFSLVSKYSANISKH